MSSTLYDKITLAAVPKKTEPVPQAYKGFSTINPNSQSFSLYDLELIKQDLLNQFHVRRGERLMNPTFGTIIWDLLFEPMTEQLKEQIVSNVNEIINYDPRLVAQNVIVTTYQSGIQIECTLKYLPYNIQQSMQIRFDQANGLLAT
jgi:phage baseplate assembly protein W